jgi:hypothetical protein
MENDKKRTEQGYFENMMRIEKEVTAMCHEDHQRDSTIFYKK